MTERKTALENIIRGAKHFYYVEDMPLLTDAEYDNVEKLLRAIDPESEMLDQVGAAMMHPTSKTKIGPPPSVKAGGNYHDSRKSLDSFMKKVRARIDELPQKIKDNVYMVQYYYHHGECPEIDIIKADIQAGLI